MDRRLAEDAETAVQQEHGSGRNDNGPEARSAAQNQAALAREMREAETFGAFLRAFASFTVAYVRSTWRSRIVMLAITGALTWILHTYIVVFVNDGWRVSDCGLRQILAGVTTSPTGSLSALKNCLNPLIALAAGLGNTVQATLLWFLLFAVGIPLASRIRRDGLRQFIRDLGQTRARMSESYERSGHRSAPVIIAFVAVGYTFGVVLAKGLPIPSFLPLPQFFAYSNRVLPLLVAGTMFVGLGSSRGGLMMTIARLVWQELRRGVLRFAAQASFEADVATVAITGSTIGLTLAAILPLWIGVAASILVALMCVRMLRQPEAPPPSLLAIVIGLAPPILAIVLHDAGVVFADDGGWSESRGMPGGWLQSPGAATAIAVGALPAAAATAGAAVGGAIGAAAGAIGGTAPAAPPGQSGPAQAPDEPPDEPRAEASSDLILSGDEALDYLEKQGQIRVTYDDQGRPSYDAVADDLAAEGTVKGVCWSNGSDGRPDLSQGVAIVIDDPDYGTAPTTADQASPPPEALEPPPEDEVVAPPEPVDEQVVEDPPHVEEDPPEVVPEQPPQDEVVPPDAPEPPKVVPEPPPEDEVVVPPEPVDEPVEEPPPPEPEQPPPEEPEKPPPEEPEPEAPAPPAPQNIADPIKAIKDQFGEVVPSKKLAALKPQDVTVLETTKFEQEMQKYGMTDKPGEMTEGFYDPNTDRIFIRQGCEDKGRTSVHEYLHKVSNGDHLQSDAGSNLEEAFTEHFSNKVAAQHGLGPSNSVYNQDGRVAVAEDIEALVGEDTVKEAYFGETSSDIQDMADAVDKKCGAGTWAQVKAKCDAGDYSGARALLKKASSPAPGTPGKEG